MAQKQRRSHPASGVRHHHRQDMTSNHPHPYSQSSGSGDSMMMMQDEVVYRERNMYDGDNAGRGQGGRARALTTTGGGGNSSSTLGNTQASATSPGTLCPTQSSLHNGNPPSLPRHERKRRVRAIEEADRAEDAHAGASPLNSDVSPLMARATKSPPPSAGVSYRSRSGGAANPFAMLEALVAPQQQQQRQRPEQHESRENDHAERKNDHLPRNDEDEEEEDDLPGLRSASEDRAGRPDRLQRRRSHNSAPSSSTKRKAPPDDGCGEADKLTARRKDVDDDDSDCDFPNHEVDPVDASERGASTSRGASSTRWNAAGDRPHRGGNMDNHAAAVQRPHDSRPEAYRPVRRNELSDHTNDGQFRGASVQSRRRVAPPPPPNPQPPTRIFLDDPRSTSILEHSRRQLSKAAQRASHKPSKDNVGSLRFPSIPKAKAVVRASSRSIVGSR
jgi:hypothetical protein